MGQLIQRPSWLRMKLEDSLFVLVKLFELVRARLEGLP